MQNSVYRPDEAAEYYFHEGCHILELLNSADDPAVSIARARVTPGVTTRWHSLKDTAERYLVLDGQGVVEVGDLQPVQVSAGDVVRIAPGIRQRIKNTGSEDLVFLAICSPRFQPQNYLATE